MSDDEPPAALLTRSQRDYLRGDPEAQPPNAASERALRSRIRSRLGAGLMDFVLLADPDLFKQEDLVKVLQRGDETAETSGFRVNERVTKDGTRDFDFVTEEEQPVVDPAMEATLVEMVVFLYRATSRMTGQLPGSWFNHSIESGTKEAYARFKPDVVLHDVELKIDATKRETATEIAAHQMEQNEELAPRQIQLLLESEDHSDEEVGEYVRRFREDNADE